MKFSLSVQNRRKARGRACLRK
ncbi:hypothetical protein DDR33_11595 [Pararcticibacter amylolyticus]|uniref:Uncharacterized protein n=1 Tax=Pararcticibacter amylolyticus TaxID=2173175 RepID=A0A2U2PHG0_9SPHI|nr:hypothetical protein DDR33_11595 [Pararcticibacter amylolyticus]